MGVSVAKRERERERERERDYYSKRKEDRTGRRRPIGLGRFG